MAFRDYCIAWLADRCPSAEPSSVSLHTENQGWLWFNNPKELGFKASTGFVDLYVAASGYSGTNDELAVLLGEWPLPTGFQIANDTFKHRNVVLRHRVEQFRTAQGVPAETASLDDALEACCAIVEWYEDGGKSLLDRSGSHLP